MSRHARYFFMTGHVDYLEGLGRVIKISRYEILLPCNKTHYSLWLTLRVIKLFGETECLHLKKNYSVSF